MEQYKNKIVKTLKTRVYLKNRKGQEFSYPKKTFHHLLEAKRRVDSKLDAFFIVTGAVGSGKSNKSKGLAGVWEDIIFDRDFGLDKIHFGSDTVIETFDKDDNHTEAINYDEAIQGATGRDNITKTGQKLRRRFVTKRTKKHLVIFNVDNLKELNDKIIERCVCWYHVYYTRDEKKKFNKGFYKTFSPKDAVRVFTDLKEKKVWKIEDHYLFKKNFIMDRDADYSDLWYSEEEYDKKKLTETSKSEADDDNPVMVQRNKLLKYLNKEMKVSMSDLAPIIGITKSGVSDAIKKV